MKSVTAGRSSAHSRPLHRNHTLGSQSMQQDIHSEALFKEADDFYRAARQPGTGQIGEALELHVAPDHEKAVFTGFILDSLEGSPAGRICQIDLRSGDC